MPVAAAVRPVPLHFHRYLPTVRPPALEIRRGGTCATWNQAGALTFLARLAPSRIKDQPALRLRPQPEPTSDLAATS